MAETDCSVWESADYSLLWQKQTAVFGKVLAITGVFGIPESAIYS